MRAIGFSTGALAKGDFRRGLRLQPAGRGKTAIELSALRDHELKPLIEALPSLDLGAFSYVSLHAPSRLAGLREDEAVNLLQRVPRHWPIIVHPEVIETPKLWQDFGAQLCLENMDNRKSTGRTVGEMRDLFRLFAHASFCLDVGHARQIDPTMTTALFMLAEFADRLVQIHVSEVGGRGEHLSVSRVGEVALQKLTHRVPHDCPLIIESVVEDHQIDAELDMARDLFNGRVATAIA